MPLRRGHAAAADDGPGDLVEDAAHVDLVEVRLCRNVTNATRSVSCFAYEIRMRSTVRALAWNSSHPIQNVPSSAKVTPSSAFAFLPVAVFHSSLPSPHGPSHSFSPHGLRSLSSRVFASFDAPTCRDTCSIHRDIRREHFAGRFAEI